MDVCVVTYRNTADRITPALRPGDDLWVRDNSNDNIGFARAANELAGKGSQPVILFINPDGDPQPGCFEAMERAVTVTGVVAAEADDGLHSARSAERRMWLSGACLAVQRAAFEQVGGFDESMWMYGEDVDLSRRLAPFGALVHSDEAIFVHDTGPRSFRAERNQALNQLVLHARYGIGPGALGMLRGSVSAARSRRPRVVAARLAGLVEYLVRRPT